MPAIGQVTKQKDGNFKGQLKTLSFRALIDILLNPSKSSDSQPDYRVYSGALTWVPDGARKVRLSARITSP